MGSQNEKGNFNTVADQAVWMNSVNESLDAERLYLKALRQAFHSLAQQLADKIERQLFKDSDEHCSQTTLGENSSPTTQSHVKGLEQEVSAMKLTWTSAHTALTQNGSLHISAAPERMQQHHTACCTSIMPTSIVCRSQDTDLKKENA